jgi:hypothetical protein
MNGLDPAGFATFFAALTGAAAALAGLLFVAVSINLDNIVKGAGLPARAAETLALLVFVVVVCALALVPQDITLLGAEVLVMAVPLLAVTIGNPLRYRRQNPDAPLLWSLGRMAANGVALLPAVAGGASLAARGGGGLYWLVASALLGIASAVFSAWVLLVEIVR